MKALVLALIFSCAPCPCEEPQGREAGVPARAPSLPPLEPDVGETDVRPPCGRTEDVNVKGRIWRLPLPCRPYDRMRDLADPAP